MILIIGWFLIGGCVGYAIADGNGGEGGSGFLWGALFGPLGWIIVYLMSGAKCPACFRKINKHAIICPYCRTEFAPERPNTGGGRGTDQASKPKSFLTADLNGAWLILILLGIAVWLGMR